MKYKQREQYKESMKQREGSSRDQQLRQTLIQNKQKAKKEYLN